MVFGFSAAKLIGAGIAFALVAGLSYGAYAYVSGLSDKVATLTENNAKLTIAAETQAETIGILEAANERQAEINSMFAQQLEASFAEVDQLREALRVTTSRVRRLNVETATPADVEEVERDVTERYNRLIRCFGREGGNDDCQ